MGLGNALRRLWSTTSSDHGQNHPRSFSHSKSRSRSRSRSRSTPRARPKPSPSSPSTPRQSQPSRPRFLNPRRRSRHLITTPSTLLPDTPVSSDKNNHTRATERKTTTTAKTKTTTELLTTTPSVVGGAPTNSMFPVSSSSTLRSSRFRQQTSPSSTTSVSNSVLSRRSTRGTVQTSSQQERAAIAVYRDCVMHHVAALDDLWNCFDSEPGDARIAQRLRHHRAEASRALDSYFAALGARTTVDLPHAMPTLDTTDARLAQLEAQVEAEVSRFETSVQDVAARFAHAVMADARAHVTADADDTLIELQIYDGGWGPVMPPETRARLRRAADDLRDVLHSGSDAAPPPPGFDDSASRTLLHSPALNGPSTSSRYKKQSSLSSSSPPSSKQIRSRLNSKQKPQQQLHTSPQLRQMFPSPPSRSSPPVSPPSTSLRPTSTDGSSQRGSGSESGDDSPLRMVMSRTRTLRDMAQTALNHPDDAQLLVSVPSSPRPGVLARRSTDVEISSLPPPNASASGLASVSASVSASSAASASASASVSASVSASASASISAGASGMTDRRSFHALNDPDQSNPTVSKNMSFASTLYHTNNARIDAISDVGITLQRSVVRGDGRCLFRALVRCRSVSRDDPIPPERVEREEADELRLRAVAELKKYRELLARFFVIEGNFAQYIKKMAQPRTYGGEPELLVLAKVLHVPIAVYIVKGDRYRQIQVYGKQYRGDPLRILYSDGIHYDALLPCG